MSQAAVLLMAYGAAATLDDIPAYLQDIRGGRSAPPGLVEEIRSRYVKMGGRSPLLDITRAQAAALERALDEGGGPRARVFLGMRHSPPTIRQAVDEMSADGRRTVVALPLTPFHSSLSVGAYRAELDEALRESGARMAVREVASWNDHPKLIEAWAGRVREALGELPAPLRARAAVLFTAHSLPERILKDKDPYAEELRETVEAVGRAAGLSSWEFAYQSAGRTEEPWLGPDAGTVIERLAREGRPAVVIVPIGFVSDHMETLYDDDILYKGQAEAAGLRFARARSLNDDRLLIAALADVVRGSLLG